MDNNDTSAYREMINNAYAAFNARNIDGVLRYMHPNVKWPRAWEGDHVNGHQEVRSYWQHQWQEINPTVTPTGFRLRDNGNFEVEVEQLVKDLDGNILFNGKVLHIYTINNGLLERMDIEPAE